MTSAVHAQEQVLLLAPETPDPVLIELYHRLEAELRIHGFDTVTLVSAAPESDAGAMLGAQASARHAFAAIAVVLRNHNAALDVWLVERDTGKTTLRSLSASAGDETANLVAVRAVDLLRASVAARARQTDPAAAPAGASPSAAARATSTQASGAPAATSSGPQTPTHTTSTPPRAATASARARQPEPEEPSSPPRRPRPTPLLTFRAEAFGVWQGARFGVAAGPALGASVRLLDALRIGVVAAGARGFHRLETSLGSASVQQELFELELELRIARVDRLQLAAALGTGVMLLQAEGHPIAPLVATRGSQWSWQASLGPRLQIALSDVWSLTAAVRLRAYAPDVVVAVKAESARLGRPSVDMALGLAFSP